MKMFSRKCPQAIASHLNLRTGAEFHSGCRGLFELEAFFFGVSIEKLMFFSISMPGARFTFQQSALTSVLPETPVPLPPRTGRLNASRRQTHSQSSFGSKTNETSFDVSVSLR